MIEDDVPVTVAGVMTRDPVCVGPGTSLFDVAELLDGYGISGLPVIDTAGQVVGVTTRTDLVHVRAGVEPWSGWHGLVVGDLMSRPASTVGANESVGAAAELMSARQIHRLVVVDDDRSPIGVISETDVVCDIADGCED